MFKAAALHGGDIIIVDQNVDISGTEMLGTDIIAELICAGYAGFACIRSGDSTEEDQKLSRAAGAHWHVGKEVPLRELVSQLQEQYGIFLRGGEDFHTATVSQSECTGERSYLTEEGLNEYGHKTWAVPCMQLPQQ